MSANDELSPGFCRGTGQTTGQNADVLLIREECDSFLDSIESPGILIIINGPEHDELSLVYLHLSCITWGPTCQLYP